MRVSVIAILAAVVLAGDALISAGHRTEAAEALSVRDLLSACRKSANLCGQVMTDSSVSMAYIWNNCIPKDLTMMQKDRAVLRWLAAHPDLSQEDVGDGVADASAALWPCSSGQ